MCDQAKILDIDSRNAEYIETVAEDIIAEAIDIVIGFVTLGG
jgi:mRNA interferase MazF